MSPAVSAPNRNNITALILCGGRGSRLGNADKGLLTLHGQTWIARTLKRIASDVATTMISANRNLDVYRTYGYPVISDANDAYLGPLAGIAVGLDHSPTEWVMILPCDAPQWPIDLVQRLSHAIATNGGSIAVAHDGQRLQPTFMLVNKSIAPCAHNALTAGRYKLTDFVMTLHPTLVDFSAQADGFSNINTPADLAAVGAA